MTKTQQLDICKFCNKPVYDDSEAELLPYARFGKGPDRWVHVACLLQEV